MNHKKLSILLVLAGILAGIGGVFLFFIWAPAVGNDMRTSYPEMAWLFWPALGVLWCIAILYASSLALYLRISIRIGENRSFCDENVRGLRMICRLMSAAAVIWLACIVVCMLANIDIGPTWLLFLLAAMATAAFALLAYALSALLHHAVQLQEDSDLTV
ncbi:MAG: DUF2975 domain-containing protein [Clostridia bacterium]|nr:DUF2975 domain-containing protein [Clostridia bacterium]MBR5383526.1 DUF2975 domain-containing protein [Clostridia bacterium]